MQREGRLREQGRRVEGWWREERRGGGGRGEEELWISVLSSSRRSPKCVCIVCVREREREREIDGWMDICRDTCTCIHTHTYLGEGVHSNLHRYTRHERHPQTR